MDIFLLCCYMTYNFFFICTPWHNINIVRSSVTATLGNLQGSSFTRDLHIEGSGDGHLPPQGPLRKPGGGPFTGNFVDSRNRALKTQSLPLGALWGEPGGLIYWDPEGYVKEGSGDGYLSLHRDPTGEPGRGLIYQGLWKMNEKGLWKQSTSQCGSSMRGTWREGSFTGKP